MTRSTAMKLRQSGLSIAFFVGASFLLYFNDAYFRTAEDIRQLEEYRLLFNLTNYLLGGLMGGILFSLFEFFLLENLFARYGLAALTIGRAFVLMAIYVSMTTVLSFYYNTSETNLPPWRPEVVQRVLDYLTSPVNTINLVFYFAFAMILVYFHQISAIVGRGVLGKFLFAHYKRPRIVARVFLFLDLTSSTSIAESIGADRFFALIQDFLTDAGREILEHGGEINKYVGDEIIAVWPLEEGARRGAALCCVAAIRSRIAGRANHFRELYGYVPEFKAGLHAGEAIVGELGDWKREIAYMGDVLNTTARIQGACKKTGDWVLVSEDYRSLMADPERWRFKLAGRGRLRGKENSISLYRPEVEAATAGSVA